MTLWLTTRESDVDKTRDSGPSAYGHAPSDSRSVTAERAPSASAAPYILLISSSVLEREALSLVLERGGFDVDRTGPDLRGIMALPRSNPAVVLVEVPTAPEAFHRTWFDDLRRLFPQSQLVLLVEVLNPEWLVLCRKAGLSGYLTKASAIPVILRQLQLIADGESILPMAMLHELARVSTRAVRPERTRVETLTPRDIDILQHLVAGHSNKVIAGKLNLAESTVKVAMKAVFAKITVTNRTQAAVWALNHGFDEDGAPPEFVRAPTMTRR